VFVISKELARNIEGVHGEAGRAWLNSVPRLVNHYSEKWDLKLDQPFENLSYNLVITGLNREGQSIVLKLGPPCAELVAEAAALNLFAGRAAVRLLADDADGGALLLEQVYPGTPLHELQDEVSATRTAARLMLQLQHAPPPEHSFPSLKRWFRSLNELKAHPFPTALVEEAKETFATLAAWEAPAVILHGDLHHENILFSAERGWLAIDPKGVCGDPGCEVGTFMLNQLPRKALQSELREILSRRLSIFSDELEIEKQRLTRWAFCHAVLSASWSLEEGQDYGRTIKIAQLLSSLS